MLSRIGEIDEYEHFNTCFKWAYAAKPDYLTNIIQTQLKPKHQKYLKIILQSKRVVLAKNLTDDTSTTSDSEGLKVPRKIITVKRRFGGAGGNGP